MRPKVTARKTTGGVDGISPVRLEQYKKNLELLHRAKGQMVQKDEQDRNTVPNNNGQLPQVVQLTALEEISSGKTDNQTISVAVGLNEPTQFQQLPIKVVSCEMFEEISQTTKPITMDAQETAETNDFAHPVRYPSELESLSNQLNPNCGICSFSTRKTISSEPSKSAIPANNIHSNDKSSRRARKRSSKSVTSHCQENEPVKKSKRTEELSRKKFLESCDKKALLKTLVADDEIDAEELLKGYKEKRKRNNWDKKDIREETSRVLDVNFKHNDTNSVSQMSHVQKCLIELSHVVGDHFIDTMLETFSDKFNAAKVLEVLKSDELKGALLQKFTAIELLDLFRKSDISNMSEQILETISVDQITKHIQSRTDINIVELMLIALLEKFSQIVPDEVNHGLENTVVDKSDSRKKMINGVVNLVKSNIALKTSECLLNVLLQNGPKIVSNETKKNIKNFLEKRYSASELNDLSHEVMKFHLSKKIIEID